MIEPYMHVAPRGVSKLSELMDIDLRTYYENEKEAIEKGEIYVIINDLSYTKNISFRLAPLTSILNQLKKNELENNLGTDKDEILQKIEKKIDGLKGRVQKEINKLKKEIKNKK